MNNIESDHPSIPLPDYTVSPLPPYSLLRDIWENFENISTRHDMRMFFKGALAALNVLGRDETLNEDQITNLARQMIHECKFILNSTK